MVSSLTLSADYALAPMESSVGGGIVITAPGGGGSLPPGTGSGGDGGSNPIGGNGGAGGGAGGNGGHGYQSAGKSAAANAWADAHAVNNTNDSAGQTEYQHVHDMLANVYDYAQSHPNETIDIGVNNLITWQQVVSDVAKTTITVVESDTLAGDFGAVNRPLGTQDFIFINPTNANSADYQKWGDSGTDFQILHEIGHELAFYSNYSQYASGAYEAHADLVAWTMERAFGIPQLPGSAIGM